MADSTTVQVALRVRPLVENEINRGCRKCLQTIDNQIQVIGTDKAFTYNFVFDESINQSDFYETAIKDMVGKLFKGYNVTILAYGQTGSGKTHSMGTSYTGQGEMGVIPRAVKDIFYFIEKNTDHNFRVTVSFMELYQECLYDLLSNKPKDQCVVDIREDTKGIKIPGLTEQTVLTAQETTDCLINGSAGRAVGATAMNAQSSRSHAIFTVTVFMQNKNDPDAATTSKFHLVDLAGSERSKKTKATGERFKEGVNINRGLLALGNVISALGDDAAKGFISYRDSKLTRLLQDSLGGNSMTLMIACVSPADYNLEETISTLRYADRARKIKNKPIINQDPKAAEIARLHQVIQQLRLERFGDGSSCVSSEEVNKLKQDNIILQNKNRELNTILSTALAEHSCMSELVLLTKTANDKLKQKLLELKETYNVTMTSLNLTLEDCPTDVREKLENIKEIIGDLNIEHKKNEEEIRKHEYQSNHNLKENDVNHELHNNQPDLDERQESHTKEQLHMNKELKELNRVLALKEQLASQIISNTNYMVDYAALTENEQKIAALEKEKDELMQQLKNAQTTVTNSKISEQRRKRVKELETQISDLNKKVVELARMIKLKEKDELKIKQLNSEIQIMKTNKVKLIKAMRADEQKFRAWKTERERDLMRLKEKDRKRQNEMVKMERMHCKQQTVLKRKVEEAHAVNKRLKDALALQKQAQERRGQNYGKTERIQQWVTHELEVLVSTVDAERTLEQLDEDRALLTEQLNQLLNDPQAANSLEAQRDIRHLKEDIELRSAQIFDLKQKIVDSDQENKAKTRWDMIQSMVEAKCALKQLFELAAEIRTKAVKNEYKLDEINQLHQQTIMKLEQCENKLAAQSSEYENKLSEVEKEYEEKVSVLLKQLRGIKTNSEDEELKARLKIQDEWLEKMDEIKNENDLYKQEVELLRDKIAAINAETQKVTKKEKKTKSIDTTYCLNYDEEDEEIDDDDEDQDPDWRKTPLLKRLQHLRSRQADQSSRMNIKRNSDGTIKCSCKTSCSSKQCGCRKMNSVCSENCKCNIDSCQNKQMFTATKKLFDDEEDSFKRPSRQRHFFTLFGSGIKLKFSSNSSSDCDTGRSSTRNQ